MGAYRHRMNRFLYFCYFLITTDYSDLSASIGCAVRKGYGRAWLLAEMTYCAIVFGSSFVDYFNFQFYRKSKEERAAYATMGYMYRFHRALNVPEAIPLVDNKFLFPENFGHLCNRSRTFTDFEVEALKSFLMARVGGNVVFKDPDSTAGRSVRIIKVYEGPMGLMLDGDTFEDFCSVMFHRYQVIYLEEYIEQHEAMAAISPSGVNTIRVITILESSGRVRILGTVFRISVNSPLDNFSQGNLAAEIDQKTGIVLTGGIRKRSCCDSYHDSHPVTGVAIKGFQIPYWQEIIEFAMQAALVVPGVRSVGWDIAVTSDGPILVEGNSKWNKDTWQIPAGYGKKSLIAAYLD